MKSFLKDKKILLLFSHPDDEIICGWPVLQDKEVEKQVFICSNDADNPEREWCKHRVEALTELMNQLEIPFVCLNYNSGFYRLETRGETLSRALRTMMDEINAFDYDVIFTHNPIGEYGHIDHILVHQLAMTFGKPVVVSDIFIPMNWVPYQSFPEGYQRVCSRGVSLGICDNDLEFYSRCEQVYRKHNVWTWCKPPIKRCNLYLL